MKFDEVLMKKRDESVELVLEQPFSPVYHGNATVILDDKNEIVSFDSKLTSKKPTMIRKNLSDSDLADDEVDDDSSSDSSMDDNSNVNPWSNRLHHHHSDLAKKRGSVI